MRKDTSLTFESEFIGQCAIWPERSVGKKADFIISGEFSMKFERAKWLAAR